MCGFVGFTGKCGNKDGVVREMLNKILHRGPDSHEVYVDEETALGFARLSIIDLEGGTQPIFNEDQSLVLIFNGEIYNFRELREELLEKGHTFATHSDTEVIVHGYEEYGAGILDRLRGMFAFTIWNKKTKELFGARDHFGIKPYYYGQMEDCFLYGSEIKSFLPHPAFVKEFHEELLPHYLTYSVVPGYDTFFKNVYKLPPGHYYRYKDGEMKVERYFLPMLEPDAKKSLEDCGKEIVDAVTESVKAHQFSEVKVGCFLSGGVDSSYIAYELAQIQEVDSYTIGFEEMKYSEAPDAQVLAKEIGIGNEVRKVGAEEYFATLGEVQYHMDEPLANPSANLLYFLSKRAAEDVKVVLSGEGADEMFAGYNVYKDPCFLAGYQRKVPSGVRKAMAKAVSKSPNFKGKNFIVRLAQTVEERYLGNFTCYSVEQRKKLLKKSYVVQGPDFFTKPYYEQTKGLDDVSKMQYLDIHGWLVQHILLKADKMSMAHSLELRVPFLDKEIFAVAKTVPAQHKASKENTKLALRWAADQKFNRETANRIKKAFPLPLPDWLREEKYYKQVEKAFLSPVAQEFFETKEIMYYLEEHKRGTPNLISKIWTIYSFVLWYEEFFVQR